MIVKQAPNFNVDIIERDFREIEVVLKDFATSDKATLRCTKVAGITEVDSAALQLGPLVELLTFGRRSLPVGTELKLREDGSNLHAALVAMPKGKAWAYRTAGRVGALRVRAGRSATDDDIVQQKFLMDVRKQLEQHGVPQASAKALTGAAGELLDNIGEHAGLGCEALAAFDISRGGMWLSVGDSGNGVLATYHAMPDIQTSSQALKAAVIEHRSSTGDSSRGLGFQTVLRALQSMDATLRVRSDNFSLEIEGAGGSGSWMLREQTHLRGFVVSAHVCWGVGRP